MMKKTHVAAGLAIAYAFNLDPVLVVAGAIMPDIDYAFMHRKLLHNIFVMILAFLYNIAFGIGWLSHIVLDALTVYGVAWLWPLCPYRRRYAKFKTGGLFDHILFFAFLMIWIVLDVMRFI